MNDLINEFRNSYIELENLIKTKDIKNNQNLIEDSYLISGNQEKNFIKECREMRNMLSHSKVILNGKSFDYFVPTLEVVEKLKIIINKIKNPKLVTNICVSLNNIYSKKLEDLILPSMKEMSEKIYTHLPILNNENKVIGVFSENTIFSYLLDEEIIEISKITKFSELQKYLDVNKHLSEIFKFVKRTTTIKEAKKIFEEELKENKKIGMVFITENGRKEESVLGIFTPWDLAGEIEEN